MKRSKYKNIKCECDGYKFDSKKEMARYTQLAYLVKIGEIKDLELQPKFQLVGADGENLIIEGNLCKSGKPRRTKMTYSADFKYYDIVNQCEIIEDVKGFKTDVYKIKKAIMQTMGYDIIEI